MFNAIIATGAAAIACVLPACQEPAPPAVAPCEGIEIVVAWDAPVGCDLTPPQVLTLDYAGQADEFIMQDCADHGGTLEGTLCKQVDY
jgi:hypothetical protein